MSKPIRVLQVVTHMERGGLETMLMNFYRNIDRSKAQFDFLVHRDNRSSYDDEIKVLGGKIYRLPRLVPWNSRYLKELDDFFTSHKEYKIVHVHQDCLSSVILRSAMENGVPVRVAHSHSASQDKNLKYLIKLYYKRLIPKYATDLFACGKEAGGFMFGKANYTVLNNAISAKQYVFDAEARKLTRNSLGLSNDFTIGLTARFSPVKNHMFLLEIFSEILKLEKNSKLLLIGDGELRERLIERAMELKISDRVVFAGVRNDVPKLLSAMDAFVMPSLYEGVSLASIEAQAAGLPCFISDKVSLECKVTELITPISLEKSAAEWAREILSAKGVERRNTYDEIVLKGYDITRQACVLQNFYLSKYEEI